VLGSSTKNWIFNVLNPTIIKGFHKKSHERQFLHDY